MSTESTQANTQTAFNGFFGVVNEELTRIIQNPNPIHQTLEGAVMTVFGVVLNNVAHYSERAGLISDRTARTLNEESNKYVRGGLQRFFTGIIRSVNLPPEERNTQQTQ